MEFSIINQPPPVTSEFLANYGHIYGQQASYSWSDPKGIWGYNGLPTQLTNGSTDPKTAQTGFGGTFDRAMPNGVADTKTATTHGYNGVVGATNVKTPQAIYNGMAGHVMPIGAMGSKSTAPSGYSGIVGQMMPNNATYSKVSHVGYNQIVGHVIHNGSIASAQVAYPAQNFAWLQVTRGSKN